MAPPSGLTWRGPLEPLPGHRPLFRVLVAIVDLPGDLGCSHLPDVLLPAGLVLGGEQIPHGREQEEEGEVGNILPTVLPSMFAQLMSSFQGYTQPMRAGLPRSCWRGGAAYSGDLGLSIGCRTD